MMFFDVTESEIKSSNLYAFSIDRSKAFACFLGNVINCYEYQTKGRFSERYISFGTTYSLENAIDWIDGKDTALYC